MCIAKNIDDRSLFIQKTKDGVACRPSLWLKWRSASAMLILATGCTTLSPPPDIPARDSVVPKQWNTPLPQGDTVDDLALWWLQFNDPTLISLIEASQRVSRTIAEAGARIADARAQSVGHGAAMLPAVKAAASSGRGRLDVSEPAGVMSSIGFMASWELDLFGGNRAGLQASQSRLAASEANWHAARISVASEVATYYVQLRACESRLVEVLQDAQSRRQTANLTAQLAGAGFASSMAGEQANASAADGEVVRIQQQEQCDIWIKRLVSLSGLEETSLKQKLQAGTGVLPRPVAIQVAKIPAQVLAQRPDVRAAEHDVIAAMADVVQADAYRRPRISLSGSIGFQQIGMSGMRTDGRTWQIGPVAITMPLFDGGQGRANAEAARVRQQTAKTTYAAVVREAIREVEVALVKLRGASTRQGFARTAANGFSRAHRSSQSLYEAGMASLLELEDARRSKIAAQRALTDTEAQQVLAWIALYRALGGGWHADEITDVPHYVSAVELEVR